MELPLSRGSRQWNFLILVLYHLCGAVSGDLYRCMIPLEYCLGSLLPIAYTMQNVNVTAALVHLRNECPTMSNVELCVQRFPCQHEASRIRMQKYLRFFAWLCRNTSVLEQNMACWNYPFDNDVTRCGQRHIAGEGGARLSEDNHPCSYVQELISCILGQMRMRPQCSEAAVKLYSDIITQSSVAFSGC